MNCIANKVLDSIIFIITIFKWWSIFLLKIVVSILIDVYISSFQTWWTKLESRKQRKFLLKYHARNVFFSILVPAPCSVACLDATQPIKIIIYPMAGMVPISQSASNVTSLSSQCTTGLLNVENPSTEPNYASAVFCFYNQKRKIVNIKLYLKKIKNYV